MRTPLSDTIGNDQWLRENEPKIKKLFPATWSYRHEMSVLKLGYHFKLLGIDWRTEKELVNVMVFFEKIGMLQSTGQYLVRANPESVFKQAEVLDGV